MRWITLILLLLLAGCTKSGTYRDYDMKAEAGNDQFIIVTLTNESRTDTDSGDAGISPQTSASVYGPSQASGAEALMDDVKYVIEKWLDQKKINSENPTTTTTTTTQQAPPVVTPIEVKPLETVEPNLADYDVVEKADCDKEMYYTHTGESSGTKQKRCVFSKPGTEYGSSFLVQWSSGNTLVVPDSASMAWDTTDFRKYQPVDPEDNSGNAGVYAGRGDTSSYAQLLVKKQ